MSEKNNNSRMLNCGFFLLFDGCIKCSDSPFVQSKHSGLKKLLDNQIIIDVRETGEKGDICTSRLDRRKTRHVTYTSVANMFVTVRFGHDEKSLFNTDCSVLHFVHDLKRRCTESEDNMDKLDLSDESGLLIGISNAPADERAANICTPYSTYILLERRQMSGKTVEQQKAKPAVQNAIPVITEETVIHTQPKKVRFAPQEPVRKKIFDHYLYYPLLNDIYSHYPNYYFHRSKEEKRDYMKKMREMGRPRCGENNFKHRKSLFPTSAAQRPKFDIPTSRYLETKSMMGRRLTLI